MHRLLLIPCLAFLISACSFLRPVPEKDSLEVRAITADPFGTDIQPEILENDLGRRLRLEKVPVENIHIRGQMDTVLVYHFRQSDFYFYESPERVLFFEANIRNPRVRLIGDLRTGITRNRFFEAFSDLQPVDDNPLVFTDEYEMQTIIFTFENNRLKEVKIERYID